MNTTHARQSVSVLYKVFGALMVLLLLTIVAAEFDMGSLNFAVATLIATVKAVLIILFFMHVKQSVPLTKLVVCAGFFWLLIMFTLTFADYWTRGWLLLTTG
jgi:cytochrome c oxidase subunit 4